MIFWQGTFKCLTDGFCVRRRLCCRLSCFWLCKASSFAAFGSCKIAPAILLLLAFAELRGYDLRAILNCFFACFIAFAIGVVVVVATTFCVFGGFAYRFFLSCGVFADTSVFVRAGACGMVFFPCWLLYGFL